MEYNKKEKLGGHEPGMELYPVDYDVTGGANRYVFGSPETGSMEKMFPEHRGSLEQRWYRIISVLDL